ncbi:MAG TPA: cell division/cell wall cluster transcriptional repressor MraZ [Chloroflexota bacterium]|nr:cell division/cell wall cluster transcriptional repressor MraZ [Chloroflexota bacterium]
MLFGEYDRTVDYKGRLSIPGHLLTADGETDWSRVMVLKGEQPCLYVYDVGTWKAILDEAYRSLDDDEARAFMHRALSDAQLSDVDNLKRVTLPAPLLEHAGIEKQAIIVGMFNRLEIWEPALWHEYLSRLEDVTLPSIADLSRARIREVS